MTVFGQQISQFSFVLSDDLLIFFEPCYDKPSVSRLCSAEFWGAKVQTFSWILLKLGAEEVELVFFLEGLRAFVEVVVFFFGGGCKEWKVGGFGKWSRGVVCFWRVFFCQMILLPISRPAFIKSFCFFYVFFALELGSQ